MTTPILIASARASDANSATTSPIDTTGATTILIIVEGVWPSTWAISDNKGNSYTETAEHPSPGGFSYPGNTIFYLHNPIVGAGHTFTAAQGGHFPGATVEAWSGLDTAQAPYGESASTTTATSSNPGSVTPLAAGDLLVTKLAPSVDELGIAIDSGFTLGDGAANGPTNAAYLIAPDTSAVNPAWTWTTSQAASTVILAFRAAVATTPPQLAYPIADIDVGSWQAKGPGTEAVVNLLNRTESFDNPYWNKIGCTVPAADAVTDADGDLTAETLTEDGGSFGHLLLAGTVGSGLTATLSVDVRPNGRNWTKLQLTGINVGAWFNVSTGAIGTIEAGITASIVSSGNGYYRCAITGTGGVSTMSAEIFAASADGVTSFVGSGTAALDLSRADLRLGSIAGYQPILATTPPLAISSTVYPALADGSTGTPDDSSYAFVLAPGVPYWFKLGPTTLPALLSGTAFSMRGLSPQLCSLQVDVYQGYLGTLIATRTINLTASVAQSDLALTDPELANVTDLTDIHGRMVGLA